MNNYEKEFVSIVNELARVHGNWNIWSDFVSYAATRFAILPPNNIEKVKKTTEYMGKKYSENDILKFCRLIEITIESLNKNPEQDFLGSLYMLLNMGNKATGQVFTPYELSELLTKLTFNDMAETFKEKEIVTVSDPAVGGGSTLIAFANECRRQNIDYRERVLFYGQDIDLTVANMCYIQLCILGCQAVIIIGDTLTNPPTQKMDNANVLYSPLFCANALKFSGI